VNAFGRYQFMSGTWAGIGGAVNPHDQENLADLEWTKSPANQDKAVEDNIKL
jgi:muramidase (phage lysozyme)